MKADKWFGLERVKLGEGNRPYVWPEKTRRMWRSQLKERLGCGIRKYFKGARGDLERIDPSPSIFVFFPKDYDMSGHLASIRKVWENLLLFNYGCSRDGKSIRTPGTYFGTGAVAIWTPHVLRKLAELSPLFVSIWEDLKRLCRPASAASTWRTSRPPLGSSRSKPTSGGCMRNIREKQREPGHRRARPEKAPGGCDRTAHADLLSAGRRPTRGGGSSAGRPLAARWPGFWRGYVDLAACALAQGDPKKAYAVIRRAQQRFPDSLEFRFGWARTAACDWPIRAGRNGT